MKILWICGAGRVGGAERVTLQLAGGLRARGHEVTALCRPTGAVAAALNRAGLAAHAAPLGGALRIAAIPAVGRALDTLRPDIAWVTTADEWVWSCLARRPPGTRLVLVRHMALPLPWTVRCLASRRADAVVAVSDAVRDTLLGGLGIRPERIHVIPNPCRFAPSPAVPTGADRERARAQLGLPSAGRWVGFFGGRLPHKGLDDVRRAVQRANQELGDTRLLICGPDGPGSSARTQPELGEQSDFLHAFPLHDRVRHLGEIDQVDAALVAMDLVVMATHRQLSEGSGAVLMEAMACGTPVVAYATGGMPEVVGPDGDAGRLARPDDAGDLARIVVEVLRDPAAAQRMATAALARARTRFDPELATDRYEALFRRLEGPTSHPLAFP